MASKGKIGILTGGGDCPGLNAVIRAVCRTSLSLGFEVEGLIDGFEGLYGPETIPLRESEVDHILSEGGTILGTSNIGHYGPNIADDVLKRTKEHYDKLGFKCLVCIGGDGTMTIAYKLSLVGINVVGVPKTIDNDLRSTDQTFGFDSAVSVVTEALDRLHTTAASHHRVMVVEVMGRNAGWIALHSGVAGGANVILLPEVKWSWEALMKGLLNKKKCAKKSGYNIVVVAEGSRIPEGGQVVITGSRLGGVADRVAAEITKQAGLETRVVVLGHVQRGGSPTSYDRILATKYGTFAAQLACSGESGKMVSLRGTEIVSVPITKEMEDQRLIDVKTDQLVLAARTVGVVFGDEN
jgi:6-phosphofructokinase 1